MGESITVRMALKDSVPVASILSLKHRNSVIYKYGCSDDRYHAMGGMPFLFWRLIEDAKSQGIPVLDFGRSDLDNAGLIRFKDQWGTQKAELTYYRLPLAEAQKAGKLTFARAAAKQIIAHLPDSMLQVTGKLLYRHIG
jgi:lipid II:glycine glycyltransferase (peptidoglycan interpeptide bridge formation enzyme)